MATMLARAARLDALIAWERNWGCVIRARAAGAPRLSTDEGWLRYRQQLVQGLLVWTPTLRHSPLLPDMQAESVSLEMIRRTATAIDDVEALDSL